MGAERPASGTLLARGPRQVTTLGLLALVLLGAAALLRGAPSAAAGDERRSAPTYEHERREAIRKGCAWIAAKQNKDGGFGEDKAIVALTALSVLALMSDGSTDGRGPYGKEVHLGVEFLLRLVEESRVGRPPNEDGYFEHAQDFNSKMHGQGYATLALASVVGTSDAKQTARIRRVLERAVRCIERAQTPTGGFGYDPVPNREHEGSVTVTVAQGLRAARDAGILVNAKVANDGLFYLKRSQRSDPGDYDGSFRYSLHQDRTSYALTAAALSSFFLYGSYTDDKERTISRGLNFLMGKGLEDAQRRREWWYYGNFYAAWACWQKDGDRWDAAPDAYWGRWHRVVYPRLFDDQRQDGSWDDPSDRFNFGPLLPTTFAVLTLAIPDEVLPIFQR
jgi:hypothetical protein